MPDVRNCKRCGRIYNYIGGPMLCQECMEHDEEDFKRIKEYLYNNPRATMIQVSKELEVSTDKITRFLKEGRLEIVGNDGNFILECERCGKSIRTGRYCNTCQDDLARGFSATADSINKNQDSNRNSNMSMRYMNKLNKSK